MPQDGQEPLKDLMVVRDLRVTSANLNTQICEIDMVNECFENMAAELPPGTSGSMCIVLDTSCVKIPRRMKRKKGKMNFDTILRYSKLPQNTLHLPLL